MTRTFAAYVLERFRPAVFLPAILGLAACATAAGSVAPTRPAVTRAVVLTGILVAQFRLWDDLEDRERDARTHPDRVLVRSAAQPFWVVWTVLFSAGALLLGGKDRPWPLLAYGLLVAAMFLAYRQLRAVVSERLWSEWLLLAKYPAFVVIIALAIGRPSPVRVGIAAAMAFTAAHLYERAHTRAELPGVSR
jgi:4-hydroxybenzoate polyprenyltransferase